MGAGASNLSVTDLSVYQSAISKINQDLVAKAENINQQDARVKQIIKFKNGDGRETACDKRSELRTAFVSNCQGECQEIYNKCTDNCINLFENNRITFSEFQQCNNDCDENNDPNPCMDQCVLNSTTIIPDCTAAESSAMRPTIKGCDIRTNQNAAQSLQATQIASAHVDAEMTANVMNSFESVIDKTISQVNLDLNFQQFNSSEDRTNISQKIRNEISNAIESSATNKTFFNADGTQETEFVNLGFINCCGNVCDPEQTTCSLVANMDPDGNLVENPTGSPGTCGEISINQEMMQNLQINQTSKSVIESIFNSEVVNDLFSKFTFKLDQVNKGVNLLELLAPFIFFILLLVGGGLLTVRTVFKSLGDFISRNPFTVLLIVALIVAAIVVPSVLAVQNAKNTGSVQNVSKETENIKKRTGSVSKLSVIANGSNYEIGVEYCAIKKNRQSELLCKVPTANFLIIKPNLLNIDGGLINSVLIGGLEIVQGGTGYEVGDILLITGTEGVMAELVVSEIIV